MAHLSSEDKAFFKENGYLVVRGVIDPEDVQTAIDLIWDNLTNENVDRDDPSTWLDQKGGNVPNVGGDDFAKRLVNDTTIFEMAEELVGKNVLKRGGGFLAKPNFPRSDKTWRDPGGHLDGYSAPSNGVTVGTVGIFTLGVTMYVSHVKPRGGGFTVWPRSHRLYSDYFRTFPIDTIRTHQVMDCLGEPFEFTGEPGDICFWHHWMIHTAGPNIGDDLRLALIARFSHQDSNATKCHLESGDLWRLWDGLRDV